MFNNSPAQKLDRLLGVRCYLHEMANMYILKIHNVNKTQHKELSKIKLLRLFLFKIYNKFK